MKETTDKNEMTPQERRELLAKLLRKKAESAPPRNEPMSFAQERLWTIDQIGEGGTAYNIVFHFSINGPLNVKFLEAALQTLISRHETLRTTFHASGGVPVQTISASGNIALGQVDLSDANVANDHDALIREQIESQQNTKFELTRGPLIRALLIRGAPNHHVLVITLHHIIADGWSVGLICKELGEFYSAKADGRAIELRPLPLNYSQYATRQRQWLLGDEAVKQLAYWRNRLEGLSPTELLTDYPRPPRQRYQGDQRSMKLSGPLSKRLCQISKERDSTIFITLLAGLAALLSKITGNSAITIGTPIANRNAADIERLVGFFVNMLVLRIDAGGDPSFDELVSRAKETSFSGYVNQDYPFEKLVEQIQPQRDPSRSPLFQVAMSLHNEAILPPRLAELETGNVILPGFTVGGEYGVTTRHTRYDIEFHLWDRADGIAGTIVFDSDLYRAETIEELLESFVTLLENVAKNPACCLSNIGLTSARQTQLFAGWSSRKADYPSDASVQSVFECGTELHPNDIAVLQGDQKYTYAQLNAKANHIARELIAEGVQPGNHVYILMKRSATTIAAILGVLKAGGIYVPLDPDYPLHRIKLMLNATDDGCVIASESYKEACSKIGQRYVVVSDVWPQHVLDSDWDSNPSVEIKGNDPAYVMFTSGSTGEPKGVVIPHRGITRLVCNNDFAKLDRKQTLMQMAPLAFDASTFEIWGALLNGGKCAVYEDELPTPHLIGQAIKDQGVTTMFLTTALFNTVVDEDVQALEPLTQLLFGGETCSAPHLRKAMAALPNVQIIHVYGPTEATTFATAFEIPPTLESRAGSIPIGRPIRNTEVRVQDNAGRLAPPGMPGELYIGGPGVALGYLNNLEQTSERFVHIGDAANTTWYRTGDIVRWTSEGLLDFIGRTDQQVKVHGFRIELGEIEAALTEIDGVGHARVIAIGEGATKRLVAYLVPSNLTNGVNWETIRSQLRNRLPEYMIPVQHVQLDKLPLNANGKLDRTALPSPSESKAETNVAPEGDLEHILTKIWSEVLELDEIGVNQNFFDVGGQSLLLVKVHERLTRALGIKLPVVDLFRFTTIRSLGEHLTRIKLSSTPNVQISSSPKIPTSSAVHDAAVRQRLAMGRIASLSAEGGKK